MKKILDTLREKGVCTTDYFMELVAFYESSRRTFYRALKVLIFLDVVERVGQGHYQLAGTENRLREVMREMIKEELGAKTK